MKLKDMSSEDEVREEAFVRWRRRGIGSTAGEEEAARVLGPRAVAIVDRFD